MSYPHVFIGGGVGEGDGSGRGGEGEAKSSRVWGGGSYTLDHMSVKLIIL